MDISILIPSRNEIWLNRTLESIFKASEADTEAIVVLDGDFPKELPPIHPKLTVVYLPKSIGQRAATNLAAKLSKAKYLAKSDAHMDFSPGFDRILMEDMQDDWITAPTMRNLHAFDWVCPDGHRRYQGPSGPCSNCKRCGHVEGKHGQKKLDKGVCDKYKACGKPTKMDVVWKAKDSPKSRSFLFDAEPHFQYFGEYTKRPEFLAAGDLTESMSLQGSFFMMTRKRYWDLNISDEKFGSWGSQGVEISCKNWGTGGRVIINNRCFYAHLFRTQGGDFSFPYPQQHSKVLKGREYARKIFYDSGWKKLIYPLSFMLEKFWPIPGWTDADYLKQKNRELRTTRSGIYTIENVITGDIFVFSAPNIWEDAVRQEYLLRQVEHPNSELQRIFTKETEGQFRWHVEMFCRESTLPKFLKEYKDKAINGLIKHPRIG